MHLPLRVICRDLPPFPSLDCELRRQVAILEHLTQDLIRCEVTLASAAHHGLPGSGYVVDVDVHDGDSQLLAHARQAHDDIATALQLAFGLAARALVGRYLALLARPGRQPRDGVQAATGAEASAPDLPVSGSLS